MIESPESQKSRYSITIPGKPIISDDDPALDNLFGDFTTNDNKNDQNSNHKEDLELKIRENKEILDLLSFKIALIFLEKVLVVLKNNKLSEGKCMGHIGVEFASQIDPQEAQNVLLNANFSETSSIWNDPTKLK